MVTARRKPAACVVIPPPDPSRLRIFGSDYVDDFLLWNHDAGVAERWQFVYRAFGTSGELRLEKMRKRSV
jgi:hypothetical protein